MKFKRTISPKKALVRNSLSKSDFEERSQWELSITYSRRPPSFAILEVPSKIAGNYRI
jgi:hypothetical protein